MKRVVPDTNILVSALVFGGLPGIFLSLALERRIPIITSNVLLEELEETLKAKFAITEADAHAARSKLENTAEVVAPLIALQVIREDPDDDRVLECAVAGNAEVIVSGDRHLLRLGSFQGIAVMTVRQFLERNGLLIPPEE